MNVTPSPPLRENIDDKVVTEFTAALARPDAVITDAATLTAEGHDFWGFGGTPGLLLRPCTREEVVAVVRIAAEHHIPLVTRGGATNCAGAMMPNPQRVLIDLSAMNQVLNIDPTARTARVQPGVINADLQQQLAPPSSSGLSARPARTVSGRDQVASNNQLHIPALP